jgi:hypothetical protein
VKVDIYSFGIVLLEIVCARRNADQSQPESAFHLLTMLQKKGDQDRVIDIVENLDEYTRSDREEITRMIKVLLGVCKMTQKEDLSCQQF